MLQHVTVPTPRSTSTAKHRSTYKGARRYIGGKVAHEIADAVVEAAAESLPDENVTAWLEGALLVALQYPDEVRAAVDRLAQQRRRRVSSQLPFDLEQEVVDLTA